MEKKQSWETCKYSLNCNELGYGDELGCTHQKIVNLGVYPMRTTDDGLVEYAVLFPHYAFCPSEKGVIEKKLIERALAGCKHCKYYKQREF